MHTKFLASTTLLLALSACQGNLPTPIPLPTLSPTASATPQPTPTPTASVRPTPLPTAMPTPATNKELHIITVFPSELNLGAHPLPLQAEVLQAGRVLEAAAWEVLTPETAEIRSGHLVFNQVGKLELRAYAPSAPNLEERLSFEIRPLPVPTPTPQPALPAFERVSGLLGEVVSAGNYAFVADQTVDQVHVVDTRTGRISAHLSVVPDPDAMAVSTDRKWVYVGSQSSTRIDIIDVDKLLVSSSLPVGNKVFDLLGGKDRLYVSYVDASKPPAIYRPSSSTPLGALPEEVPGHTLLAVSPNGETLYVGTLGTHQKGASSDLLPDETTLYRVDIRNEEEPKVLDNTIRELTEEEEYLVKYRGVRLDPILGIELKDLLMSPDGKRLFLALSSPKYPSQVVVEPETLKVSQTINIGSFPDGLDFSPDGKYLYVTHLHYDVHVYDAQTLTQVYRQPTWLWSSQVTAAADGQSVLGLQVRNSPGSNRELVRFFDVAAFSNPAP